MSRPLFRTAALAAALAFAVALPVAAAPTVTTIGGDTRVALSSEFTGALSTLGVSASPSFPARLKRGVASFPIPTGEIDLETARGEIVHGGGLTLTAGATVVNLSSFVIDTSGDAPVLTGLVKLNDTLVARLPLFDLALGSAPVTRNYGRFGTFRVDDVSVTLTDEAAAALNDVFGVTAFAGGIPIGTATVNTAYYEPEH